MGQESNRTLARQQAIRDQIPPSTVAGLLGLSGHDLGAEAPDGTQATGDAGGARPGTPQPGGTAGPVAAGERRQGPGGDAGAGPGSQPRQARPSWPQVLGTTVRLWVRRHLPGASAAAPPGTPPPTTPHTSTPHSTSPHSTSSAEWVRTGERNVPRRRLVLGLIVLAVVIVVASGLIIAMPRHAGTHSGTGTTTSGSAGTGSGTLGAVANVRREAAAWVASQLSRGAIVACDPAMCTALQAQGLAAPNLLTLQSSASDPLGSDVVVATAAVRSQFGSRLADVYAPTVIASFGTGAARIDVRAVAPDGTAAYQAALATDRTARQDAGRQLLRNRQITVGTAAGRALASGQVDSRLLIMLAAIAARYPLNLVTFGAPPAGASAAIPLRSVDVRGTGRQSAAELRQVLAFLQAQLAPYHPLRTQLLGTAGGRSTLRIDFGAPSPLGLLGAHA